VEAKGHLVQRSRARKSIRVLVAAGAASVVVGVLGTAAMAANPASPLSALPYGASGFDYQVVPNGSAPTGFEQRSFDPAAHGFSQGAAAFGNAGPGFCAFEGPIVTNWPLNTDLLVRRMVALPPGTTGVAVHFAIDNDLAEVFWNGTLIAGPISHDGCATRDSVNLAVPQTLVMNGANLLAVHAVDRGVISYFDVSVTAVCPATNAKGCPGQPG
jgi:hypothetical protein